MTNTVNTTEPTVPTLPPLLSHQLGTHLSHFTLLFFESTFHVLRHGIFKTNAHTTWATYHGKIWKSRQKHHTTAPTDCISVLSLPPAFSKAHRWLVGFQLNFLQLHGNWLGTWDFGGLWVLSSQVLLPQRLRLRLRGSTLCYEGEPPGPWRWGCRFHNRQTTLPYRDNLGLGCEAWNALGTFHRFQIFR